MDIQLIKGEFNSSDTLELITQMVHAKIKYHEGKIHNDSNEEDIKYREDKIKRLQKNLYELQSYIRMKKGNLVIQSSITIE